MTSRNSLYLTNEELQNLPFKQVGEDVLIDKTASFVELENVSIGNNVRIDAFSMIIGTGPINIGSNIHISAYSYLAGRAGIILNDFSNLSSGVRVYSISDDYSG